MVLRNSVSADEMNYLEIKNQETLSLKTFSILL